MKRCDGTSGIVRLPRFGGAFLFGVDMLTRGEVAAYKRRVYGADYEKLMDQRFGADERTKRMIFSHESPEYAESIKTRNHNNGAYWYSTEIVEHFIPNIKTDRNWVTIGYNERCYDHSIVFAHCNLYPHVYKYLAKYDDLILVCSWPQQLEAVKKWGRPVFLPMSVDVEKVKRYATEKDRDTCFAGRMEKCTTALKHTPGLDFIAEVERDTFLSELAHYRRAYAIDRVAIEAKVLGCEVLPYDRRFPDPGFWRVIDSREAAAMLQDILDGIDG